MHSLLKRLLAPAAVAAALASPGAANAFCGFYVASGNAELFNEASKVVMVRDGDRTVITMVNDFQGETSEFAMVIPSPVVLNENQIHVTEPAIVEHLDAYTAPRLVEYHDENPCNPRVMLESAASTPPPSPMARDEMRKSDLGVTIEAEYTVGEYDIVILSAKESSGLETWLRQENYRIPEGAGPVLASYIRQGMKFFVAKVNLAEHAKSGNTFLRPLQIAFESEKFMLPIRLGTVNAKGTQDLILWTLTRKGRVETANYRAERMPTDNVIPTFVKKDFGPVYKAIYGEAIDKAGGTGILLEYAWDMGWCDPCASDPLSTRELKELGVYWAEGQGGRGTGAQNVFVTRLHARYDAKSFPEDLRLVETGDRQNFQGRYVMHHPWQGEPTCQAAREYLRELPARFEREARTLASLTGWDIAEIRARMERVGQRPGKDDRSWIEKLWD